jgi:hypothetical protein
VLRFEGFEGLEGTTSDSVCSGLVLRTVSYDFRLFHHLRSHNLKPVVPSLFGMIMAVVVVVVDDDDDDDILLFPFKGCLLSMRGMGMKPMTAPQFMGYFARPG